MTLKVENDDVIEFQTWLNQAIRRAWILAIAVAIPGAFLLTLWFPDSPEALVGVALLGIAIGVMADAVEHAKKRRRQEIEEMTATVHKAVQEVTRLIEERIGEGTLLREGASVATQQAEIEAIVERELLTNPLLVKEMKAIHTTLLMIRQELAASRSAPLPWDALR